MNQRHKLIIAEHNNQTLKSATYHAIAAAEELPGSNYLLIVGYECASVIKEASNLAGIEQILLITGAAYEHQLCENTAYAISQIAQQYDYIIAASSTYSKNLMPRLAALLDIPMISDVIKIIDPQTFERPIYAGNAIAQVQIAEACKLITIRTTAFKPISGSAKSNIEVITLPSVQDYSQTTLFVGHELSASDRPELTSAKCIVAGGRGLKSAENFKLIEQLADQLHAAIGASRAAVDAGFAPNDYQVGQTGKVVAPQLYIAIGISGAIQHVAGMKDSKIIVAINSDPEAPIFQIADYGLVGDLFVILPQLLAELKKP